MSKFKIEDIRKELEDLGWNLISTEYVNLKTDLQVRCSEGHDCFISYEKLRRGNCECPICKQNQYFKMDTTPIRKKGFRILALDQASITTGWAVYDDKELIKFSHWSSDGKDSTDRIAKTKQWVAAMIESWKPDKVVIEDIQLQRTNGEKEGVTTYKKLAHLQGVLINYFYEKNLQYDVVPPATWRSYSEIKGKQRTDQKKNAQLKVKRFYDVSVTQDEADAILIGRYAANQYSSTKIIEF